MGNGLHAQRQNPEVKVRIPNPTLAEVKGRLEHFNQVACICCSDNYIHVCCLACRKPNYGPKHAIELFVYSAIVNKQYQRHY